MECGHADVVEVLLSYQVDGEARDGAGDTSLHLAVKYLHVPIINALLRAGTNPNLKNMVSILSYLHAATFFFFTFLLQHSKTHPALIFFNALP